VTQTVTPNADGSWLFTTSTNYLVDGGISYTVTATQGSLTSPSVTFTT